MVAAGMPQIPLLTLALHVQEAGTGLVDRLVGLLADKEIGVRRGSAHLLGRLPREAAIKPLVARLGDPKEQPRSAAADAVLQVRSSTSEVAGQQLDIAMDQTGGGGGGGGRMNAGLASQDG